MKNKLIKIGFLFVAALAITSCNDDDIEKTIDETKKDIDTTAVVVEKYNKSGYVITSASSSSAGTTNYVAYFKNKPTGDIDLSKYNSTLYTGYTEYNGFLYTKPAKGDGITILGINKETEELEEIEGVVSLSALDLVRNRTIINDELGVYTHNDDDDNLYLFNPTTLKAIQTIDMSGALSPTIENFNRYDNIVYRKQDNKLFIFTRINDLNTTAFYDSDTIYVEVVNLDTNSWESTAVYEGAQYPTNRNGNGHMIDESGNIYVTCLGSYGIDLQVYANAKTASRPQILKIPAGSTEFDKDYSFNPVNAVGYENNAIQLFVGATYDANGIAYAAVSAGPENPEILRLIQLFGAGKANTEDLATLLSLATESPITKWAKLDLVAKTATVIDGIPFMAGYNNGNSTEIDGKFLFKVVNEDEDLNQYYEYDPVTETSSVLYSATGASGTIGSIYKLEE